MSLIQDFEPENGVLRVHSFPRFGHSNHIANLASTNVSVRDDYIDGMIAFAIFVSLFFIVWCLILLSLKFHYGVSRVGCGAGGGIVHVDDMRKHGTSRSRRKRIILRNWRIQYIFLAASITLPALSVMLVNRGLDPFLQSLVQVQEINNEVDTRAYMAIQTTRRLLKLHTEWVQLVSNGDWLETHCPNYATSKWASQTELARVEQNIASSSHEMSRLEQEFGNQTLKTLYSVTRATGSVEIAIDWVHGHDWIVKMFLITLNVINAFFFFGALLTKNNIDYHVFQDMTSYILLPLFCIITLGTIGATCAFAILAMANADFCSGGAAPGSPMGTFLDSAIQQGYNESSLVYESLNYYALDCTPTNPFSILVDTESLVATTAHSIRKLHKDLRGLDPFFFQSECGGDMLLANATLFQFQETLHSIRSNLDVALDLTDCSNVTQIFREVSFGMTCTDSVEGLGWLFSMILGITILSMIMLTTRAALFNPLIQGKRKKRREKEFEEYKEYMSQFYETSDWKIDVPPEKETLDIAPMETFETEQTEETDKLSPKSSSSDGSEGKEHHEYTSDLSTLYEVNSAATSAAVPISGKDDDDVSYYSSDSDWGEDESAFSISSSVAALMNFVASVRKPRRDAPPDDDDDVDDDKSSVASSIYTTISAFVGSFLGKAQQPETHRDEPKEENIKSATPPPLTTPTRSRISNDPLHLGFYHNSDILSDASSQEMEPLSPPLLLSSGGPKAPRKGMKTFARTVGGSKCND